MSGIAVAVDLGNPGQLLACCGLLAAADRRRRSDAPVTGWFESNRFRVATPDNAPALVAWLCEAHVAQVQVTRTGRRGSNAPSTRIDYAGDGDDPAVLKWPDDSTWKLRCWSQEDFAPTRIKTFAGQMRGPKVMAHLLEWCRGFDVNGRELFDIGFGSADASVFGFDGRKGRAALDIGFSADALKIGAEEFPFVELFAALGLETFRPSEIDDDLLFGAWTQPLPVELARAAAGCAFRPPGLRRFRFGLRGRKARSGVEGAPNDQYKAFTRAVEVFGPLKGEENE